MAEMQKERSVVTDNTGTIVGEDRFYPFGETRFTTGTMFTDKLFTGQREITGLGNYHYGARFYSPKLGRFISADTIVPGYANPQSLNRYSYVLNNPLRYTDPTGHMVACEQGDVCRHGYPSTPRTGGSGNGGGGRNNRDDDDPNPTCVRCSMPTPLPIPPPPLTPIPSPTLPAPLLPSPTATSPGTPPFSFTQSAPDYEKITEGTVLLVSLFLFVDIPIGIGLVGFFPEMEVGMLLTEVWVYPLVLVIVDAHIHAINLIYEGFTGEERLVNPIIDFP